MGLTRQETRCKYIYIYTNNIQYCGEGLHGILHVDDNDKVSVCIECLWALANSPTVLNNNALSCQPTSAIRRPHMPAEAPQLKAQSGSGTSGQ